jgi:hypothetical protein
MKCTKGSQQIINKQFINYFYSDQTIYAKNKRGATKLNIALKLHKYSYIAYTKLCRLQHYNLIKHYHYIQLF